MIVAIFRNRLRPEVEQEYGIWANRMSELAAAMPGYISHKGFIAQDGERVTLIEFESEEAMREWGRHSEHVQAKKKGRADFYSEYRVQICMQLRESIFPSRSAVDLSKERE
jgi:heme-degrading monooxygenase HmoA